MPEAPAGAQSTLAAMNEQSVRATRGIGVLAAALLGCATSSTPPDSEAFWDAARTDRAERLGTALVASEAPLADGALRVRLAFDAGADLDLYVSDPLEETVYYANNPTGSGGVLDADRRCEDAAPRIEQIEFPAPLAGRYRVGVDFPAVCKGRAAAAPFVLEVRHGVRRVLHRGAVAPIRFEPAVAEIELSP